MVLRLLTIIGLLAVGLTLAPRDARPADSDIAAIVNSGSTNRSGFRIVIDRSGVAKFAEISRGRAMQAGKSKSVKLTISRTLTDRLFTDLKAANPLAALPAPHCMKSVSFGSTLSIEFRGEQTPDLSCGSGGVPEVQSLIRGCDEIVALFPRK